MADINKNYYNTTQYKNAQALQNSSMDSISKKYGFDFSRNYANNQAETMAQAQRNAQNAAKRENESANKLNLQRITDDYRSGAKSLDRGYFQQYLGQGQSQTNRGLTGGMVADQNLRLAMNKQGELADLWRDRNRSTQEESMRFSNTNQTIMDALAQIEKERGAYAEQLYQDGLFKGYNVISQDRNYGLQLDNMTWGRYQDMLDDERARAALAASRSRGGGGGSGGARSTTPVTPYTAAKSSGSQSALGKYYNTPAINAVEGLKAKQPNNYALNYTFKAPTPPAQSTLSPWAQMQMFGR